MTRSATTTDEHVDRPPRSTWHNSALVDTTAYAFSWAWVAFPLAFWGNDRKDYLFTYIVILALTDVHRHFGLPYVYMDKVNFAAWPLRYTLFPAMMFIAWLGSPWLATQTMFVSAAGVAAGVGWIGVIMQLLGRDGSHDAPDTTTVAHRLGIGLLVPLLLSVLAGGADANAIDQGWWWLAAAFLTSRHLTGVAPGGPSNRARRTTNLLFASLATAAVAAGATLSPPNAQTGVSIRTLLNMAAAFAFLWNIWHVYMQKYGIMRLYNAKAGPRSNVPGWIDRWFIFAWLPLYFSYLAPMSRDVAMTHLRRGSQFLPGFLDAMEAAQPVTVPLSVAILVGAIAFWFRAEWRASRLRNRARVTMAVGTHGLAATFLVIDPVKAYLAFACSHAIEYIVFVWAFQRRQYDAPLPHRPMLQRVLQRPWLATIGFAAALGAFFIWSKHWGGWIAPDAARPRFAGFPTVTWLFYWGVYQSCVHFYFDGFMWKMRRASIRAHI